MYKNHFKNIRWGLGAIVFGLVISAMFTEIVTQEKLLNFSFFKSKEVVINKPDVSADSFAIYSLSSHKILSAQNPEQVLPIASLTKLVTAVVAIENMPHAKVDITRQDISEEGNTGNLITGDTFTTKELLYPLLMVSSNDAAAALARHYGKSQFISKMNSWVWSIGATNTSFVDPTGLSYRNVSSIEDMVKIVSWMEKNRPEIFNITNQKIKNLRTYSWTNKTPFLNMSEYLGGKNGFTDEAKRTSISLFSYPELGKDFEKIAIMVLKSNDRNKDTLALLHSFVVK